jgi:hypothetical protein
MCNRNTTNVVTRYGSLLQSVFNNEGTATFFLQHIGATETLLNVVIRFVHSCISTPTPLFPLPTAAIRFFLHLIIAQAFNNPNPTTTSSLNRGSYDESNSRDKTAFLHPVSPDPPEATQLVV